MRGRQPIGSSVFAAKLGAIGAVSLCVSLSVTAAAVAQSSDRQAASAAVPASGVSANPSSDAAYAIPTDAVLRSFDSALTDLARQGHITIVTEDTPLHPRLSDEALGRVKTGLKSLTRATFADALESLAKAYDYEALPDPKGDGSTVVLVKRYSDPDDLPFVTFDEGGYAIRMLTRHLDSFNPHIPDSGPDHPLLKLLTSLNADEYRAAGGESGLPVASLGAEQKEWVGEWVENQYIGTIQNNLAKIDELIRETRGVRSSYRWMKWMGSDTKIFGIQLPSGQNGDLLQFGLSHGFLPQFVGGVSVNNIVPAGGSFIEEVPTERGQHNLTEANEELTAQVRTGVQQYLNGKPWPDPTAPNAGGRETASPSGTTLGHAVASLNAAGSAAAQPQKFSINPALTEKVVGVFDPLKRLTPSASMRALAAVYGLRVLRGEDGSDQLTLPVMPQTERIGAVASAVRAYLPAP